MNKWIIRYYLVVFIIFNLGCKSKSTQNDLIDKLIIQDSRFINDQIYFHSYYIRNPKSFQYQSEIKNEKLIDSFLNKADSIFLFGVIYKIDEVLVLNNPPSIENFNIIKYNLLLLNDMANVYTFSSEMFNHLFKDNFVDYKVAYFGGNKVDMIFFKFQLLYYYKYKFYIYSKRNSLISWLTDYEIEKLREKYKF